MPESTERIAIYAREKEIHNSESFHQARAVELAGVYENNPLMKAVNEAYLSQPGILAGKKVLDYGCGSGEWTMQFLERGADNVVSIDLSDYLVEQLRDAFKASGYDHRATAMTMNAEHLTFSDNTFDVVLGSGILHHLNLDAALLEVRRVLREGGKAVFMEPLGVNPLLNLYRNRTPHLRSPDERPLTSADIATIEKYFRITARKSFFLTSMAAYLFRMVIKNQFLFEKTQSLLHTTDKFLMRLFPPLHNLCWYTVIELEKPLQA
ncbi:MAG: class I SAM-dependent methyltransferase [Rhizobacter sp.]|nr:class I SAM-dependent methyltransferase [Chlorobiales bacterium]